MKIEKYTKIKNNQYKVTIDGKEINLYDDVIIKYELLRYKDIDDKLYLEIIKYNNSLEAYYKALQYITKKMRTEQEVITYLDKEYSQSVILDAVRRLKESGYLNEEKYINAYIMDQVHLTNYGPNYIKKNLLKKGISEDLINIYLEQIDNDIWTQKLQKIIIKMVNTNKTYSTNKLKNKIEFDLSNKGYYKYMIDEVLDSLEFKNDEQALEKEYQKQYNRLSRKYSSYELKEKIKGKLLAKGFSYEDIEKVLSENN